MLKKNLQMPQMIEEYVNSRAEKGACNLDKIAFNRLVSLLVAKSAQGLDIPKERKDGFATTSKWMVTDNNRFNSEVSAKEREMYLQEQENHIFDGVREFGPYTTEPKIKAFLGNYEREIEQCMEAVRERHRSMENGGMAETDNYRNWAHAIAYADGTFETFKVFLEKYRNGQL